MANAKLSMNLITLSYVGGVILDSFKSSLIRIILLQGSSSGREGLRNPFCENLKVRRGHDSP
jgi:hypothetical protein